MGHSIKAALAATVFTATLSACATYGDTSDSTAASSPASISQPAADIAGAIAKPGRAESDVKLDSSRQPGPVLTFAGLKTGDSVLDIFAGGGYYSKIMARAVGASGSVTAHNAGVFATDDAGKAKWSALQENNPNLEMIRAGFNDWRPEPASFDFALSHLVFHDLYFESERFGLPRADVPAYLAQLYTAMKPGGTVLIVDHTGPAGNTRELADKLHRIDPAVVKADMAEAGFVFDKESDLFRNADDDINTLVFDPSVRGKTDRFVMKFRKPGD